MVVQERKAAAVAAALAKKQGPTPAGDRESALVTLKKQFSNPWTAAAAAAKNRGPVLDNPPPVTVTDNIHLAPGGSVTPAVIDTPGGSVTPGVVDPTILTDAPTSAAAAADVVMADDDIQNEQCFNQLEEDNLSLQDES
jgi:hypothetical protein